MQSKKLKYALMSAALVMSLTCTSAQEAAIVHADENISVDVHSNSNSSSSNSSMSSQPSTSENSDSSSNDANTSSKQTHTLNNSYVVYGAGASDQQQLANVLAVGDNFKKLTAGAAQYKEFIDPNGSTTDSAMISSVAIVPTDPGSGIKVNIKKFNGQDVITKVTAQQYAMVAQMAGITDVTITVSANTPVSGESALTGVYEAIKADGANLNSQNTQAANQMLDATQGAIRANNGDDNYPGKLMAAIGDTTKAINAQRQAGKDPSQDNIQSMLNHRLFLHGVYGSTKNHEKPIIKALVQFNNAPISQSKDYSKHVSDTVNNVKHSSGDVMNKAKQFMNSKEGKQAAQQSQNWFEKLIAWINGLFNRWIKEAAS